MRRAGWAGILLLLVNPMWGHGLDLCLENAARLDESTLQAMRMELGSILAASGRPAAFSACRPEVVRIALRTGPPVQETSALGAARVEGGRVVPEIHLFAGPVAQLLGTRLPAVLGRALARVAAHELGHYLEQKQEHAARGLMLERLSAAHLLAADRSFFLLPPPTD